jgi:hypothetical protein
MSRDEKAIASIKEEISRYLAASPAATDSIEGIQQWWLTPGLREAPRPLVELALERLITQGVIRRITMRDGSVIYSHRGGRGTGDSTKGAR